MKIAYRNILRNKLYSGITIFGLAVGIASFLFITLFIRHELSYDQFNTKKDNIYRLSVDYNFNGQYQSIAMSPPAYAPIMKDENPEIADYVRLMPMSPSVISYGDKKINQAMMFADPGLFRIFDFQVLKGNRETLLKDKFRVMLSETAADKYFGDEDPVGKTLSVEGQIDLIVDGVFEDIPENSHLQFDFLVSLSTIETNVLYGEGALSSNTSCNYYTYLLLKDGFDYKGS